MKMNRAEFMKILRSELRRLPEDERNSALEYYEEYFDEAGPQKEQQVLENLGNPKKIAGQIKADYAMQQLDQEEMPTAKKGWSAFKWAIVGICSAPISIPVAIVLVCVAVAAFITFVGCAAGVIAGIEERKINGTVRNYYILKMDIRKYFQNIDKDILMNILKRKVKEEKLVKLLEKIVYSNSGKKGLPIGNYTSQIFANIYLNEIDQYIKHELKVKYYFRYMDDSILFVKTKKEAIELLEKIKNYLKIKLELELNDKTQIFKSDQGVNFCGYKINEYRLKLRDRGKKAIKQKVRYLKEEVQKGNMNSKEASRFICGHLGYMKYANTRNLEEKLFYIN